MDGLSLPSVTALGDPDIDALQTGPVDGPTYIELRARGSSRKDEADFLAVIGWLLGKAGFESHPCDTHPPAREVILPANWRGLAIVQVALGEKVLNDARLVRRRDLRAFYSSGAWRDLKGAALFVKGRRCAKCGKKRGPFHVDHIVPVRIAWAARLEMWNLQILCPRCHARDKRQEERSRWR